MKMSKKELHGRELYLHTGSEERAAEVTDGQGQQLQEEPLRWGDSSAEAPRQDCAMCVPRTARNRGESVG